MGTPTPADRYAAFDALRAAMMLAVVVLHAAAFFAAQPALRTVFRFADPDGGAEFGWAAVLLQSVSMPAFFLTAGFFAAKLAADRGRRAMARHRLRRITLPFLAFWPVVFGLTMAGELVGSSVVDEITVTRADDGAAVLRHIGTAAASGTPFRDALDLRFPRTDDAFERVGTLDGSEHGPPVFVFRGPGAAPGPAVWAGARFVPVGVGLVFRPSTNHLIHLWFLWVLTLLVLGAVAVAPLADRVPTEWIRRRLAGPLVPLLVAVPLAGVFAAHGLPALPPPDGVFVPPATLFGYGLFFAVGAVLWRHRDRLGITARAWPAYLLVGSMAWSGGWAVLPQADWGNAEPGTRTWLARAAMCACAAAGHALLTWGCVGLFGRFGSAPAGWVRYISDASYWVYLVHLPVVVWAAALLLPWDASRFVKCPVVLALGLGLPLLTYHLCVRRTRLGVFLNGPRVRPQPAAPPSPGKAA